MNSPPNVFESLEMDQFLDAILLREPIDKSFSMLPNAAHEVVCDTDIKGAVSLARKDVDVKLLRHDEVRPGWPAFAGHDSMGQKVYGNFSKLLHCLSTETGQ